MTEAQWLAETDPEPLLEALRRQASARKLRLFACACCRRIWNLPGQDYQRIVAATEQFADGQATQAELEQLVAEAYDADWTPRQAFLETASLGENMVDVAIYAAGDASYSWADAAADYPGDDNAPLLVAKRAQEQAVQCHLLRDVFGNPFRSVMIEQELLAWQNGTVGKLAQAAYDERELPSGQLAASRLAILADALEEAGCASEDILSHLREPGPHVRGCWVVDLLLGKV